MSKSQVKSAQDTENEASIRKGIKIAKKLDELTAKYMKMDKAYNVMIYNKKEEMNGMIMDKQKELTDLQNKIDPLKSKNA